jgi:hypothetical protein
MNKLASAAVNWDLIATGRSGFDDLFEDGEMLPPQRGER